MIMYLIVFDTKTLLRVKVILETLIHCACFFYPYFPCRAIPVFLEDSC